MTGNVIRFRAHQARTRSFARAARAARAVSASLAAVRNWQIRRRTAADLRSVSDQLLADIGIDRSDIPTVADALTARAQDQHPRQAAERRSSDTDVAMAA